MINQPRSRQVLARATGEIIFEEIHFSGGFAFVAPAIEGERFGSRDGITFPGISTFGASISERNLSGSASFQVPSVAGARFGARPNAVHFANWAVAGSVSYSLSFRGGIHFPNFGILNPLRGGISFPAPVINATFSMEGTEAGLAWCTHLGSGETTRWTVDFLHILRLGNRIFGLKSDGLYEIGTSTNDAGSAIVSFVDLHKTDFGESGRKRATHVWVSGDNPVTVQSTVDDVTKSVIPTNISRGKTHRASLALGDKGRYWSFKIANSTGQVMKLNGLEVLTYKYLDRV